MTESGTDRSKPLSSKPAKEGMCTRCGAHGRVWSVEQPAEIVLELEWGYCWLCLDCWKKLGRFFQFGKSSTENQQEGSR
jgi:hypothetical protein